MNQATLLLRQVHPSFVQNGRPSSQAFRPTPKDEQKLSVYDGDKITAPDAWEHYTSMLQNQSCGVMAVSMGQCEALELSVQPDPTPYPEHVLIDFSLHGKGTTEKKAKQLKVMAITRGWLFKAVHP